MITVEHLVSEERRAASQFTGQRGRFRNILCFVYRLLGSDTENHQQVVGVCHGSSLIDAETHIPVVVITQVHFLAQRDGTQFLSRYMIRQSQTECVEENRVPFRISQTEQLLVEPVGNTVNTFGNILYSLWTVVHRIEASHGSQQRLRRTDIRRSLLTLDMLLTCLQSHTVTNLSILIFRKSDDTSRHVTLIFITRCEISSRRTTVKHRNTEALRTSEYDVGTPFTRRNQQGKTQNIRIHGYLATCRMRTFRKLPVIFYITTVVRVLYDATEYIGCELQFLVITHLHFHTLRNGTGTDNGKILRKYFLIDEQRIGTRLLLCPASQSMHHRCSLRSRSCLVQQRAVGQRHGSQVTYYRLEINQRLQSSL